MIKQTKSLVLPNDLFRKLDQIEKQIGNTPLLELINTKGLYIKQEAYQFANSIKVRPAFHILKNAIMNNKLSEKDTIIESSSGNFGIALAMISKYLGINFIAVVDKYTPQDKQRMLQLFASDVVVIDKKDQHGGYLLNRIAYIEKYKKENPNHFHPNQYSNSNNPASYYYSLGQEICNDFDELDALFVAVSTGGTISGLSRKLMEKFPDINIVAVDIQGSLVFQNKVQKRTLSGIGSSISSVHIQNVKINSVIILSQKDIICGCKQLLDEEMVFGGASTGAVYFAAKQYMKQNPNKKALIISPDDGKSYMDNVYLS
ncbi:pyridoxal-phosphate dependent enzyme [Snuella sedimenti]|uniref:Pyridoxal-phosphate dependent enzyme n=1 Tax=Snuella sedimenti TaxID=2798802 RepID=A0A8J7JE55_9FLAO|nr:pyridoxal-phosphate dependent enzyme [Snuella sedimenti]MBJ6369619.1 pyridoxal-phosphate dependent enzyme [Snuella sedimenti]